MFDWIAAHHFLLGIIADSSTFLGGLILARDAFRRLRDLRDKRVNTEFRRQFPGLNLTDREWSDAASALRWSFTGFVFLLFGFAAQFLLRIGEWHHG